jgi:hypothetical protein
MSTEVTAPPAPTKLRYDLAPIAVRLADEGVPLYAIARALRSPSALVREALYEAKGEGKIVDMPREDWPPNSLRATRDPMQGRKMGDEDIVFNCVRLFKVTRQQGSLLSVLIRRNEVSKDMMHQIIEQSRGPDKDEPTDPKMVDVVICNLRKRLKKTPLMGVIETMWGCGYFMKPENRKKALELLGEYATGAIPEKKP